MKPLIELFVEKLVPGGLGLARAGGEVVLVPGALPGETVLVELGENVRGARRGRVVSVPSPSPWRAEPDCPWADRCGGCDFLHARPEAAHGLKSRAALDDLAAGLGLEIELVESPRRERYRSRATLHLGRREDASAGAWAVGFHDARRRVVEFDRCLLLAPELEAMLPPLRAWAADLPAEAGPAEIGVMKDAAGPGRAIHFSPPPPPGGPGRRPAPARLSSALVKALERLPAALADHGQPEISVWFRSSAREASRRAAPGGPDRLAAAVWPRWGLTLNAAPGGFTQVNPAVNMLMVEKILELAAPLTSVKSNPTALDLYSGLGNIALPLLKSGFLVTAVEQSPDGAAAARANGRGLAGFTVIQGASEKAAADLARQGRTFDLAVLDPPRAGARDLAPALAALKPRLIIYLACHPAVLPRDLPALASLGYRARRLIALDMFPRTSHLESLVLLSNS